MSKKIIYYSSYLQYNIDTIQTYEHILFQLKLHTGKAHIQYLLHRLSSKTSIKAKICRINYAGAQ